MHFGAYSTSLNAKNTIPQITDPFTKSGIKLNISTKILSFPKHFFFPGWYSRLSTNSLTPLFYQYSNYYTQQEFNHSHDILRLFRPLVGSTSTAATHQHELLSLPSTRCSVGGKQRLRPPDAPTPAAPNPPRMTNSSGWVAAGGTTGYLPLKPPCGKSLLERHGVAEGNGLRWLPGGSMAIL